MKLFFTSFYWNFFSFLRIVRNKKNQFDYFMRIPPSSATTTTKQNIISISQEKLRNLKKSSKKQNSNEKEEEYHYLLSINCFAKNYHYAICHFLLLVVFLALFRFSQINKSILIIDHKWNWKILVKKMKIFFFG